MTISTIRCIVIKETFSGDSDKYIIIFAKDIGKVSVFAKGARKLKSKFLAGTALFTYGDFIVKESRGKYYLDSVDIIENFYGLRNDIFTLAYGTYFLEIIDKSVPNGISENLLLLLLLKSLQKLVKTENKELISSTFVLKLISFLGFFPSLKNCVYCGKQDTKYICAEGLLCEKCLKKEVPFVKISSPTIEAMIYIEMTSIDSVFNYNLTSKYLKELGRIGYFLVYTNFGKEIKSYEFLKNLC